jgi:DNA polymerase-3 subunit gamma/tau
MSAQAIYRRWRPQSFDDVIGQDHITHTLRNAIATDRLAHAYLFTGPRGTGKTSVARILAKAACCVDEHVAGRPCNRCAICLSMTEGRALDLIEIDAASNTGVDDVRDLRDKIGFSPNEARYKVYIIDEVHMLSSAAFNALLKTLEEPPAHALFILATTEPHKIPDTILSRCQRHDFRRVDVTSVADKLALICETEGAEADRAALEAVARSGTGSIRDAESLLDQMIATGQAITVEAVGEVLGTPADAAVADLVDAILAGDLSAGLASINAALDRGADPRQLQARLLDHLRCLLLIQTGLEAAQLDLPEDRLQRLRSQAKAMPMPALVQTIHRFNDARPAASRSLPSLPLELALIESALALSGGAAISAAIPAAAPAASKKTSTKAAQGPKADLPPAGVDPAEADPPVAAKVSVPAAAVPAASAASAGETLAELQARWPEVLRELESHDRNLAALLKDCRPITAEAGLLSLGFFYEFHCRRAALPEKSALISAAVESITGSAFTLRCTVVSESEAEAADRPRSKSEQAAQDPVVKHALENLGARIAGVQDPEPEG